MNVAIIGSGGREHTIGWKLSQNKNVDNIYFIAGNGGTSIIGTNVSIDELDFEKIKNFILDKDIKLVVVGPETPLVNGIVDYLNKNIQQEIYIIGPSALGAKLEGSKEFAKEFMIRHNIPTASFQSFDKSEINKAIDFMKKNGSPFVLKVDGLAAGKGVIILDKIEEAIVELKNIFDGKFGESGKKVVIEKFLKGIELSVFVITDGKKYKTLPTSKDYKRIGDFDTGLNTGGMGAVSPVPFADNNLMEKIEEKIIKPTINGFEKENIEYVGFVYFGLMIVNNEPFVIEYNTRLGDPETQAVIPRIENDFLEMLIKLSSGKIEQIELKINPQTAVSVVLASGGYPENYQKNKQITGLENLQDKMIFHAGTKKIEDKYFTTAGRVLAITSLGQNIDEARNKSYETINKIKFENSYYRKDIGLDLL